MEIAEWSESEERHKNPNLTHYSPAMPFGNRKNYFKGSFQFSIVTT